MDDRIKDILVDILDVDRNQVRDDFGPANTASWDSINNLRLITAIEEEFQIKLTMDDIKRMTDFGQIKAVLSGYL
jgi:acyl carrier protein